MGFLDRTWRILPVILFSLATPVQAAAPPPLDTYGDLPGIEDASISPTGKHLAIIGRAQGARQLVILDADRKVLAMVPASDAKLRELRWIGEEAVLLITSSTQSLDPIFLPSKAELFGALVIPLDGTKAWMVFDKDPRRR